jgi:hypothetical protein
VDEQPFERLRPGYFQVDLEFQTEFDFMIHGRVSYLCHLNSGESGG